MGRRLTDLGGGSRQPDFFHFAFSSAIIGAICGSTSPRPSSADPTGGLLDTRRNVIVALLSCPTHQPGLVRSEAGWLRLAGLHPRRLPCSRPESRGFASAPSRGSN